MFIKIDNIGNENCDMFLFCFLLVFVEIIKLMSEGFKEKFLLNEKKEMMVEGNYKVENMDNVGVESCDMFLFCLLLKFLEKIEIVNEGLKEKVLFKEKKEIVLELLYKEFIWSGILEELYSLEVLKNGCIVLIIDFISKFFYVFGRFLNCDVSLEYFFVFRYYVVIQYKMSDILNSEKGFYIYDFGSMYGIIVNKLLFEFRCYYCLCVGYVFKFGGSLRLFIFQV